MRGRDFGLDLVRCTAAVLVLAVHFFLNNGFYDHPLTGAGMAVSTVLRMLFMTCVPLFMVLTGYLRGSVVRSLGYYRKLLPVLLTYLLCAAGCLAFRVLWLKEAMSLPDMAGQILWYSAAPYGWYVEMYIGLFLLAPFLSAGWNGLEEGGKRSLLVTLLVLTALPPVCNLWGKVLPSWWTGIYPVTYFMLGAWLREHPVRADGRLLMLVWAGIAAAVGAGQFAVQQVLYPGQPFLYSPAAYWESAFVVGETVCAFSLLSRCRGTGLPGWLRYLVGMIARLSLPIYLLSYITDQLIYPPLRQAIPSPGNQLILLPVMVAASLAVSGLMALAVDLLVRRILALPGRGKKPGTQKKG